MDDTSELLRLCERVIAEGSRVASYMNYETDKVPDWYKDVALPSVVVPIARALKSRLQAEAQAPAAPAPVLTEEERKTVFDILEFATLYPDYTKTQQRLLAIIDRLFTPSPSPEQRGETEWERTATDNPKTCWSEEDLEGGPYG